MTGAVEWSRPTIPGRGLLGRVVPTRPRTWLLVAAVALMAGAALNWSWLVAAGIAPLILSIAPCAVMCALGVCMKHGSSGCKGEEGSGRAPGQPSASTFTGSRRAG